MTLDDWITQPGHRACAVRTIYDVGGTAIKRGTVGDICDYDTADGYLIVDFPDVGAVLCSPAEVMPA